MRISDWSSDVCSSDLLRQMEKSAPRNSGRGTCRAAITRQPMGEKRAMESGNLLNGTVTTLRTLFGAWNLFFGLDRKSVVSGKSVSVRVALGGGRIIKKNKTACKCHTTIKKAIK